MSGHTTPSGIAITSYLDVDDWDDVAFGLRQRAIRFDDADDATPLVMLTHFPPNAVLPRHHHGVAFCDAVVAGSMWVEDDHAWYGAGTVRHVPTGVRYGPTRSGPDGLTLLEFYATRAGFPATLDEATLTDDQRVEVARYRAMQANGDAR